MKIIFPDFKYQHIWVDRKKINHIERKRTISSHNVLLQVILITGTTLKKHYNDSVIHFLTCPSNGSKMTTSIDFMTRVGPSNTFEVGKWIGKMSLDFGKEYWRQNTCYIRGQSYLIKAVFILYETFRWKGNINRRKTSPDVTATFLSRFRMKQTKYTDLWFLESVFRVVILYYIRKDNVMGTAWQYINRKARKLSPPTLSVKHFLHPVFMAERSNIIKYTSGVMAFFVMLSI